MVTASIPLAALADRRLSTAQGLGRHRQGSRLPDRRCHRPGAGDGESPMPKRPARKLSDPPPIPPWWGERSQG
ncbi:hypothetical protein DDQ41_05945 [Streptomyces spongiicola]|uniref:Uncharacterized protein n=1 Tax=Streptomyces spongiicola TaxID=1690221 RepID=A0ABN5KD81_9ACTN|nr:hypothetical protein DDQ41_05945 [Streptomyces spongiicola]